MFLPTLAPQRTALCICGWEREGLVNEEPSTLKNYLQMFNCWRNKRKTYTLKTKLCIQSYNGNIFFLPFLILLFFYQNGFIDTKDKTNQVILEVIPGDYKIRKNIIVWDPGQKLKPINKPLTLSSNCAKIKKIKKHFIYLKTQLSKTVCVVHAPLNILYVPSLPFFSSQLLSARKVMEHSYRRNQKF